MNPVMLVTGASRGLGARFAAGFAARGYRVAINFSRSKLEAERLRAEIAEARGAEEVMTVQADVGRRDEVRRMFDRIEADWGEVDVLINNAGLNMDGPFLAMTDEQWERVIATNLTGTFLCSQEYALRYMGNSGRILNLGAATAFHGRKNGANYCSAKAGVIALTKCLALELAPRGDRENHPHGQVRHAGRCLPDGRVHHHRRGLRDRAELLRERRQLYALGLVGPGFLHIRRRPDAGGSRGQPPAGEDRGGGVFPAPVPGAGPTERVDLAAKIERAVVEARP